MTNQSKHSKTSNLAFYFVVIAIMGVGAANIAHLFQRKNAHRNIDRLECEKRKIRDARFTYKMGPAVSMTKQNRLMEKMRDSLALQNEQMLQSAQDEYFNKLDKRYTLGCFFTPREIAEMNKIANFAGPIFNTKTTLNEFQETLTELEIPGDKFIKFGVELDNGYIFRFLDDTRQMLFENYMDANDAAFLIDNTNDTPNPAIVLPRTKQQEFYKNKKTIDSLENQISGNVFSIDNALAEFDRKTDSLNAQIEKNRQKLR